MSKLTLNVNDNTYVEEASDGLVDDLLQGMSALFGGDDIAVTASSLRMAVIGTNVINMAVTHPIVRKRVAAGKAPTLKFFG
jgi:hypothetical protein